LRRRGLYAGIIATLILLIGLFVSCAKQEHMGSERDEGNYIAPHIASDVVNPVRNGFDTSCKVEKYETSDRIVFPGVAPPAPNGHKHQFFCTDVKHDSLLAEMHQGETNASRPEDTTGAWTMTVEKPDGTILKPQVIKLYYRTAVPNPQVPPENLKVIAGDRLATSPQDKDITWWDCKNLNSGEVTGKWSEPHQCESDNAKPRLRVTFPQCVATVKGDPNRMRVDSEDHKSHMAYPVETDNGIRCPETHPIPIVRLGLQISYPAASERGGTDMSKVTYSSGGRHGSHADWWQTFRMTGENGLKQLTERCFAPGVFCKLGNNPI
jgi:Domain of unknown function (DUF1996)